MPFRTPLSVRHEVGEEWRLLDPLVFEGRDDYFVMRKGFKTDFASIPRPVRWLFDTAGTNSEPGVLHDAVRDVMESTGMLDNTRRLVEAARSAGATIVHAPITFAPGYGELSDHPYGILKGVVDSTAFSLCMDNKMDMRVFGMEPAGNVTRALLGESIGTLVTA